MRFLGYILFGLILMFFACKSETATPTDDEPRQQEKIMTGNEARKQSQQSLEMMTEKAIYLDTIESALDTLFEDSSSTG